MATIDKSFSQDSRGRVVSRLQCTELHAERGVPQVRRYVTRDSMHNKFQSVQSVGVCFLMFFRVLTSEYHLSTICVFLVFFSSCVCVFGGSRRRRLIRGRPLLFRQALTDPLVDQPPYINAIMLPIKTRAKPTQRNPEKILKTSPLEKNSVVPLLKRNAAEQCHPLN